MPSIPFNSVSEPSSFLATVRYGFQQIANRWTYPALGSSIMRQAIRITILVEPTWRTPLAEIASGSKLLLPISIYLSIRSVPEELRKIHNYVKQHNWKATALAIGNFVKEKILENIDDVCTIWNAVATYAGSTVPLLVIEIGNRVITPMLAWSLFHNGYKSLIIGQELYRVSYGQLNPKDFADYCWKELQEPVSDQLGEGLESETNPDMAEAQLAASRLQAKKLDDLEKRSDGRVVNIMKNLRQELAKSGYGPSNTILTESLACRVQMAKSDVQTLLIARSVFHLSAFGAASLAGTATVVGLFTPLSPVIMPIAIIGRLSVALGNRLVNDFALDALLHNPSLCEYREVTPAADS